MRFCAQPHCGVMVPKGYCPTHTKPAWRNTETPNRIRGRKLQQLRDQLFSKQPLCVLCEKQGKVSIATIRDHILNLADGGTDTEDNVQPLCQECSDRKTAAEALRGRTRN